MVTDTALNVDEILQRRILDALHWDPEIRPTDIGVEVDEGIVTLLGAVHGYQTKWMVEQVVLQVEGVRAVANELEVRLGSTERPADLDIAHQAVNLLDWNASVPVGSVKVGVADGRVVLEGTVRREFEKMGAEHAIWRAAGVHDVTNLIRVRPRVATVVG